MIKASRLVLFLTLQFVSLNFGLEASEKIQAIRDGELAGTVEVREYGGASFFSLANMAKALGGRLTWYRISSKAILSVNGRKITFFFNSKKSLIDAKQITLDKAAVQTKNDLYVPADFFASGEFTSIADYNIQCEEGRTLIIERINSVSYPRIYTDDNLTRMVIEFADKFPADLKKKSKTEYSLLIYGGKMHAGKLDFQNDYVKQISLANDGRTAICRIKVNDPKLKLEMARKEKPHRILVDIFPEKAEGDKFAASGGTNDTSTGAAASQVSLEESTYTVLASTPAIAPAAMSFAASSVRGAAHGGKRVKIMLDPGHGGDDPGAVGYNGTREKNINLQIALETEKLLLDDGYEVYITRRDDTFIPLAERTNMANENKVDIFVSVHCNASMKKTTRGFEIYFMSETATDPDAEATARLENAVINLEREPSMRRQQLQEVLWKMAVNEFINESSEICLMITNEVISRVKMENRGIRQAGFYVLRGTHMPAVLVECAYLSNPAEEAKLRSGRFQKNMADSIFNGIRKYVQRKNLLVKK